MILFYSFSKELEKLGASNKSLDAMISEAGKADPLMSLSEKWKKIVKPIHHENSLVGFHAPYVGNDGYQRVGPLYIDPSYRGKGIAFNYIKEFLDGKKAKARIHEGNLASQKVFERTGFKKGELEETEWDGKKHQVRWWIKSASVSALEKANKHHGEEDKDWKSFEKNLKAKTFQNAIIGHTKSDDKLKEYAKAYGSYLQSKDIVTKVPSRTSSKKYLIKKLPDGRLACGCKDWQFKHSINGTDCFHIASLGKTKLSNIGEVGRVIASWHQIRSDQAKIKKNRELSKYLSNVTPNIPDPNKSDEII